MLGSEADACHAYFELFPKMYKKIFRVLGYSHR